MSLEQTFERIAVALEVIAAKGTAAAPAAAPKAAAEHAAAPKAPAAAPKAAASKKPVHTREELSAVAGAFREKTDKEQAKALIKDKGGVDKLADLPEGKIDALYAAFEAAMADLEAGEQSAGDDDM